MHTFFFFFRWVSTSLITDMFTHHIGLIFFLLWISPYKYCMFTNKLSFRASSWAEQCFTPGEIFSRVRARHALCFRGENREKNNTILCNRTKNAVGKPKRQGSTQVLNEFVCSLTHFLKKCGMLLESQRSDHCWLAAFEEQYGCLPHMMPSMIFTADVCTVCIYVEFMSHWFDA